MPFERALLPKNYRVSVTLGFEGGTATADNTPVRVPAPTTAESAGAPTDSSLRAPVNQPEPTAIAAPARDFVLAASGLAIMVAGMLLLGLLLRRRSTRAEPLELLPVAGAAPVARATTVAMDPPNVTRFEDAVARRASVPRAEPEPLHYPLARAAGEQEAVRDRRTAWMSGPATPTSSPTSIPQLTPERRAAQVSRLGHFSGQRSDTTRPRR